MSLPGGIRIRIVIVLVGIVAGALGTAYMIVVPSLERRLVDARLDQLETVAVPLAHTLPADTLDWQDRVETYAVQANARVVAFSVLSKNKPALAVVADSRTKTSRDVAKDPVALRALQIGKVERGRVFHTGGDYANVAVPVTDAIVLFQAPLADSLATVRLVRERLLLATAFALVLALILGLTAAGMLSHRLLRLETAAERIAGGDFGAPIVDHGNDEIGDLARTFDQMRVHLAQLDNARKEFVANASHELRTPLFSIGGFLELLADEDLDEETRAGFIETMQGQVRRLTKLSTDLLDLSRVDAGQLTVQLEPVDLGAMVSMLHRRARARRDGDEPRARERHAGSRVVPGRRRPHPPDRTRAGDERAHAHAGGDEGRRPGPPAERSRRAVGRGRRAGDPAEPARGRLRPLLPRRGRDGVRERPRPRHRARDRPCHGRRGAARVAGAADGVHARPAVVGCAGDPRRTGLAVFT